MKNTDTIKNYHAHVYFDDQTVDIATKFCQQASDKHLVILICE